MNRKILVIVGVSGSGKNTLIKEMQKKESRLIYIPQYTTRPLRKNEKDRILVNYFEMNLMEKSGNFLIINASNGIRYAIKKSSFDVIFNEENFPVIDWPLSRLHIIKNFMNEVYVVYLYPSSLNELSIRLASDGRDPDGKRFRSAEDELNEINAGKHDNSFSLKIVSETGKISSMAEYILFKFKECIGIS